MSQYKDQITGRVIADLRCSGAYLLNYSKINYPHNNNIIYSDILSLYDSPAKLINSSQQVKLFNNTSLYLQNEGLLFNFNNSVQINSNALTFSYWIYPVSTGDRIVDIGTNVIHYYEYTQTRIDFFAAYDVENGGMRSEYYYYSTPGNYSTQIQCGIVSPSPKIVVPTNQWNHLAMTISNSTMKIYLNGTKVAESANIPNRAFDISDLYIRSCRNDKVYIGEATVILDQALWTGDSFEVPNNYLTGTKEFDSKYVIWNDKNTPTITGDILLDAREYKGKFCNLQKDAPCLNSMYIRDDARNYASSITLSDDSLFTGKSIQLVNFALQTQFKKYNFSSINNNHVFTFSFWLKHNQLGAYDGSSKATGFSVEFGNVNHCIMLYNNRPYAGSSDKMQKIESAIYDSSWNQISNGRTWYTFPGSRLDWNHMALVRDSGYNKFYINGVLLFSIACTTMPHNNFELIIDNIFSTDTIISVDDIVLIDNQALWTDNFTPPNDYLTGPKERINRIRARDIFYPNQANFNDYFDKAYLY